MRNLNINTRSNFSCKDCQKRYVGCHSDCEPYKQFKKETTELRKKIQKHNEMEYLLHGGEKGVKI